MARTVMALLVVMGWAGGAGGAGVITLDDGGVGTYMPGDTAQFEVYLAGTDGFTH